MMRLDHVSYAVSPDESLPEAVARIAETLGIERVKGGVHPRFGTRNAIFPLQNHQYLEIVEALDHPASEKAPYGQAVRARTQMGGGWMGWVVSVDDLAAFEERLERKAVPGNRKFPDGRELTWEQIGIKGLIADPQVPYLIKWDEGTEDLHPSLAAPAQAALKTVTICGSRDRVRDWLGLSNPEERVGDMEIDFVAPSGTPGLLSVSFNTPKGVVTL